MAENEVATPVAPTPVTVVETPAVITEDNANSFTSEQIKEAVDNLKAGKVSTPQKVEPVKEEVKPEVKAETPVEAVKPEVVVEPVKEPVIEPSFDDKVAEAVAKALEAKGVKKEVEPVAPVDEFHGFKDAKELQEAYDKDPVEVFKKVVAKEVKAEMDAYKAEVNKSLNPIKADLESRTVTTHLNEAKEKIKELSDPKFAAEVGKILKDQKYVDKVASEGKNPYVEAAKIVRGEKLGDYEKAAYERGVKETEARLAKANRAVVEGGGKVIVETEGIDLTTATSAQIKAELARHGKA